MIYSVPEEEQQGDDDGAGRDENAGDQQSRADGPGHIGTAFFGGQLQLRLLRAGVLRRRCRVFLFPLRPAGQQHGLPLQTAHIGDHSAVVVIVITLLHEIPPGQSGKGQNLIHNGSAAPQCRYKRMQK